MHVDRRLRTIPRVIPALAAAALLASGGAAATAAVSSSNAHLTKPKHASLAGTWSGRYSGSYSGTFTLHWTQSGSSLSGSITLSKPSGKYGVTGSVHGGSIKFGVVTAGATYTGSVSGSSMSGRYTTGNGGRGTWSAHKVS